MKYIERGREGKEENEKDWKRRKEGEKDGRKAETKTQRKGARERNLIRRFKEKIKDNNEQMKK